MAWWTKVAAFATIDLAALGVNSFFGTYLSLDQKAELVTGGSALILLALIVSWGSERKSTAARVSAVRQTIAGLQAFDRALLRGLHSSAQLPPPSPSST